MDTLKEQNESEEEEKRVTLYFLGISLSYIAMVGGLLVFILILLEVSKQILGGFLSAYLALALAMSMSFLHRPMEELGLRKFFAAGSAFFLFISVILFLSHFKGI